MLVLLLVQTALVLSTVAGGFDELSVPAAARLGAQLWLLSLGVPVEVQIAPAIGLGASPGVVSLIPLGLTAVTAALAFRAGRRMARSAPAGVRLTEAVLTAGIVHAAAAGAAAVLGGMEAASADPLLALLIGGWVMVVFMAAGTLFGAGTAAVLVGQPVVDRALRLGQDLRWTGAYLWALLRAGGLAVIGTVIVGSLCLLLAIVTGVPRILEAHRQLGSDPAGDIAMALLHFALLPNLLLWAISWASGAGFSIGAGTSITPAGTDAEALPLLPVLAALPGQEPSTALLAAPSLIVLAGFAAGWWFVREGENHLGEWIAVRSPSAILSVPIVIALTAALIGAVAALLSLVLASFSSGSLGLGQLTAVGPLPWRTAWMLGLEIAVGAALAMVVGPWLDRKRAERSDGMRPAGAESGSDPVADDLWEPQEQTARAAADAQDTEASRLSRAEAEREREAQQRREIALRRRQRAEAARARQERRAAADERRRQRRKAARNR